jgi:hypothetical protein
VDLGKISPARPGRGGSEPDLRGGDGDGEKEEEGGSDSWRKGRRKKEGVDGYSACVRAVGSFVVMTGHGPGWTGLDRAFTTFTDKYTSKFYFKTIFLNLINFRK